MSTLNVGTNVQILGDTRTITGVLHAEGIMPTGAVIYTAASTGAAPNHKGYVPPGYLPCDGASYSKTSYPELWAAIQDIFSTGSYGTALQNPATGAALAAPPVGYFRVPQLQGEFIRCWDGPNYTSYDPTVSGRIFGSYQADDFKSHSHTYQRPNNTEKTGSGGALASNFIQGNYTTTGNPGGTETRPRNIALFAIIKY